MKHLLLNVLWFFEKILIFHLYVNLHIFFEEKIVSVSISRDFQALLSSSLTDKST
jgi:hypothetical protein